MYSVTSNFLTKIKESSRTVKAKVEIDTVTLYENEIIKFAIEDSFGSFNMPAIGGVSAKKLTLEVLSGNTPAIMIGKPIKPYIGIETSTGVYEYIPMGVFYADYNQIKKTDKLITIECFDKMPTLDDDKYTSALTYPATVEDMVEEIGIKYGLTIHSQTFPTASFPSAPSGTVRQVLSQIAALISTNATFNRLGELEFNFTNTTGFTLNSSNYISFQLLSESMAKISEIIVTKGDEEDSIIYGDGTGVAISFKNEAINTYADLGVVFNRVFPLNFVAYEMSLQGMPHVDVGDKITFTDKNGTIRTIIVSSHKIEFSGGVKSTFTTAAPEKQITETTATGNTVLSSVSIDYAQVEEAALAASRLIVGNEGGFLRINTDINSHPYEMVIMNTADINTADKVWRWNNGGLGFSSTGYNGTYGTAITQDGQIVANFITTGVLNANVIKAGVISDVGNKFSINMNAGTISMGNSKLTFDGTNLNITGNITMTGGSISWANVNSDPDIVNAVNAADTANSNASTALSVANGAASDIEDLADGGYSGGTFINGTSIASPTITGGTLQTNTTGRRIKISGADNAINIYSSTNVLAGQLDWDNNGAGTTEEASTRVFLRTLNSTALKIESATNMSLEAQNIYFSGNVVGNFPAKFG